MITRQILNDLMNSEDNKRTYLEIVEETGMELDYEGYTYGIILGNIINGVIKINSSDEVKEKRVKEILQQVKEQTSDSFDEDKKTAVAIALQMVIVAEYLETEEGGQLLNSVFKKEEETEIKKETKSETYDEYLEETMNKINHLASTKYREKFNTGEVEILDIAMITIAEEIKTSIESNNQTKLKKTFDNVKIFLKEQFEIDLTQIGKPIATLVNASAGSTILEFSDNKFKISMKKENNTQKVTRSVDRLLKLQNM